MSDLLSCPFCGGNAKVEQIDAQNHIILAELMGFDKRAFIECENCGSIMIGETVEDVEEKWNSRNDGRIVRCKDCDHAHINRYSEEIVTCFFAWNEQIRKRLLQLRKKKGVVNMGLYCPILKKDCIGFQCAFYNTLYGCCGVKLNV